MRRVMGIVFVFLVVCSSSAWSGDDSFAGQQATAAQSCSSLMEGAAEPLDLLLPDVVPAACTNTCSSLQFQPCEVDGQHFFCQWSNCQRWGCTCMDGIIECGLP